MILVLFGAGHLGYLNFPSRSRSSSPLLLVGESNVYTLGTIGAHRVVTTKLPSVGRTREAMTAAGNTTTRLLGIFQKVRLNFDS
ncbi:hypothetical protein EVAR_23786_1 [Eumeta japonica]|uniref:Uncharacterized protein n=1 Tax=Eumeta variegata TaxID=151549 RepID=A0A4C1VKC4_EUMVA|nr:hypothetical protein EVAR_23786_1 [Eumeta japonica]